MSYTYLLKVQCSAVRPVRLHGRQAHEMGGRPSDAVLLTKMVFNFDHVAVYEEQGWQRIGHHR